MISAVAIYISCNLTDCLALRSRALFSTYYSLLGLLTDDGSSTSISCRASLWSLKRRDDQARRREEEHVRQDDPGGQGCQQDLVLPGYYRQF